MKAMLFALFAGLLMFGCGEDAQKGTVQKEAKDDPIVPLAIPCVACGKKVSKKTEECRQCGHPTPDSVVAYKKAQEFVAIKAEKELELAAIKAEEERELAAIKAEEERELAAIKAKEKRKSVTIKTEEEQKRREELMAKLHQDISDEKRRFLVKRDEKKSEIEELAEELKRVNLELQIFKKKLGLGHSNESEEMKKISESLELTIQLAKVQQNELEEKKQGLEDEINGRILRMVADMSELELQQLDSQLNSQIEQISNLIENQVRVIPRESNVGKKPILVILGASEFTIGAFNGEQRTLQVTPATYYRQLGGTLASYEKNRNFFVYFFRPSACETVVSNVPGRNGAIEMKLFDLLCNPKNNLSSMLGFKYGFEPIHEEANVLFTNKNPDVFKDLLFVNVLPVQVTRTEKGPNETIEIGQPDSRVRNRPTAPVELTEEADYELIRESEQLENSLLDLQDDHIEMIEDLENEADRMREEIEEIKDNLDDLNSDATAFEALAKREKEKVENLRKQEQMKEEERLGLEEEVARLETILEYQELFQELKKKPYRKVSLPQQKDTKKKPLPVIVAHGKMYPLIKFGIGKTLKNEDGLTWNQAPNQRFQIKVDPSKGVDPENEQSLQNFLSSVRDAPRKVRQDFFLNLFVFSDSENFGVFNKIRAEAVLRDLDYNWLPVSELPLMLKAENVPWKTQ